MQGLKGERSKGDVQGFEGADDDFGDSANMLTDLARTKSLVMRNCSLTLKIWES